MGAAQDRDPGVDPRCRPVALGYMSVVLDRVCLAAGMTPYTSPCRCPRQEAGLGARRLLHCLAGHKLWTKLRPGVFEFLEVG